MIKCCACCNLHCPQEIWEQCYDEALGSLTNCGDIQYMSKTSSVILLLLEEFYKLYLGPADSKKEDYDWFVYLIIYLR